MLIAHAEHKIIIQVYSVTVMAHVIALDAVMTVMAHVIALEDNLARGHLSLLHHTPLYPMHNCNTCDLVCGKGGHCAAYIGTVVRASGRIIGVS